MSELINQLLVGQEWFQWVTAVIAAASAFSAATPTPKQGSLLAKSYKVIDILAVNVGKAKDKG